MSTVCSSTLLRSLVDLDVFNDQVAGIQAFGISIGLGVLEKTKEEFGRLDRPSCTRDAELLSCKNSHQHLLAFHPDTPSRSAKFSLLPLGVSLPCAARPVPPAYLLMGTASLCWMTLLRNACARCSWKPFMACAVSLVFLKLVLKKAPRERADRLGAISVDAYLTMVVGVKG
jgi:hypothetical protein